MELTVKLLTDRCPKATQNDSTREICPIGWMSQVIAVGHGAQWGCMQVR